MNLKEKQTFFTKKSLGQHFLNNSRIPERMAEAGHVREGDTVLEIGPGTGALTQALLKRGARVIALEADRRAITVLRDTFLSHITEGRLVLIHGDARTIPLRTLHPDITSGRYKVVANIPYYLSGMLFRTFLESDTQPSDLVFLVQKEVALRIARDTKESLLSLSIKVYGEPEYVATVKKGNFTPQPKIDSAIIAVHDISKKNFRNIEESTFFELIHVGFKSKRKQLISNLSDKYDRETLRTDFAKLGIREDVRAEDLGVHMWLSLGERLFTHR